jgi:hypothetical protein
MRADQSSTEPKRSLFRFVFWVDSLVLEFKKIVQILYQLVEFIRVMLCGDPLTQDGHAFALIWSHGSLPPSGKMRTLESLPDQ